jgi:mRNA-degrading endonuclease toxin of MazEF toxin-antitoxin module
MSYKKGDIVVVKFPFILKEGSEKQKGSPALVISDDKVKKRYKDIILAAITSHIPADFMESEIILEPEESTGLLKRSLLRLDFVMTIPEELISRKIGVLVEELMSEVEHKLKIVFGIKDNNKSLLRPTKQTKPTRPTKQTR